MRGKSKLPLEEHSSRGWFVYLTKQRSRGDTVARRQWKVEMKTKWKVKMKPKSQN